MSYFDYDPNRRFADMMTVHVTFGSWDYRTTIETKSGGNVRGMDVIDCAVENIYDDLLEKAEKDGRAATLYLRNARGDELECSDDEDEGYDWLKSMVVSAEITSLEREAA